MNFMKYRPMGIIGFSALGIILLCIICGNVFQGGIVCLGVGAVVFVTAVISKRLREVTVLFYLSAALIFSGALLLGSNCVSYEGANAVTGEDACVVATVTDESEFTESKSVYILKTCTVSDVPLKTKLRITSNTSLGVYPGETIRFIADVYGIDSSSDYMKRYYMSEGIYLKANVYDAQASVEVLPEKPDVFYSFFASLKGLIKERIFNLLPNEYGGVAVGMLLGDMSYVSEETVDSFSSTGITHLFAVSGLHLSIWVMGTYAILQKIGFKRKVSSLISIFFIFFIMLLTGMSPSISRAGIMMLCLMTGNLFNRKTEAINSLGFSLIILLIVNPMCASSVSLLLSVTATLGIVLFYKRTDELLKRLFAFIKFPILNKIFVLFTGVFLISIVASLFTLPVTSFTFGQASLIGPITNVLVSYPSTVLMILAGSLAVLGEISFIAKLLGFLCGICGKFVINCANLLAKIPNAVVETDNLIFEISLIVLLIGIAFCLVTFNDNIKRLKSVACVTLSVCITCTCTFAVYNKNLTTLKILDTDDGLCVIVKNSAERIVLGCCGSDDYAINSIEDAIFIKKPSLLLIPDSKSWNSLYVKNLYKSFDFKKIVAGEPIENIDCIVEPDLTINSQRSSIIFHHGDDLTYAYCIFGSLNVLIVFNSGVDKIPQKYLTADVLICSYYLPENTDLSGFSNIIISSNSEISAAMVNRYYPYNSNIYSTSGVRNVVLELRDEDNIKVIYD